MIEIRRFNLLERDITGNSSAGPDLAGPAIGIL